MITTGGGPALMEAANPGRVRCRGEIRWAQHRVAPIHTAGRSSLSVSLFCLAQDASAASGKGAGFPGGYDTFDELFEVLTLVQTRKIKPLPIVLVGESYWRRAFDVDFLVDEGTIDAEDRDLFWFAESATEIWDGILHWRDACAAGVRP